MEILAVARVLGEHGAAFAAEGAEGAGLTINLFWIIVAALNFIIFAADRVQASCWCPWASGSRSAVSASSRASRMPTLPGVTAKRPPTSGRASSMKLDGRLARSCSEPRRSLTTSVPRASLRHRPRSIACASVHVADIDAERKRALAEVRGQVAELALLAAGKVVGETMSDEREKRLVDEFLTQVSAEAPSGDERN